MNLDKLFNPLWDFRIINCNYDAIEGNVFLLIKDPESEAMHKIVFNHVSLYLFLQNIDNKYVYDSFREMSSISFSHEFVSLSKLKQKWLKSYKFDFNVVIEIINSTILIKAETVEVDEKQYDLELC